jgi:Fur family ferric uptake transcriptional regulator
MQLTCICIPLGMRLKELKEILNDHALKNTSCRHDVLSYLLETNYALAPKDLEANFKKYDRVTLYRTLNTFIYKGIIHKIPNDSGIARYALTGSAINKRYKEEHIHFKCDDCGRTECLPDYQIPKVKLPTGYKASEINVIVSGQCQHCQPTSSVND